MMPQNSRPDDFQFRLAQWILAQLKSERELETVAQQFSLLISQTQAQSVGDLYAHIGELIAQRAASAPIEGSKDHIRLCAELCYYLYSIHFEQQSSHSPRVVFIHERLFELCINSSSTKSTMQSASTQDSNESPSGLDAVLPSDDNMIAIEKNSQLLFHLFNFQLLSLAQISEYVFRVIEGCDASIHARLSGAMAGIRLLVGLFAGCSRGPWQKEANSFNKWVDQHSILDESQANGATDRGEEPRNLNIDGNNLTNKTISSLSNEGDSPFPGSNNVPIHSNQKGHSSQRHAHEEEEMNDMSGNNLGRPPRTPATSRAESPVDTRPEDNETALVVEMGRGNQETNSSDFLAGPLEGTCKPKDENTPCTSGATPTVVMSPLPTTTVPSTASFLSPAPKSSPPLPTLSHSPSTSTAPSTLLSDSLQPTTLQPPHASSPPSGNNVPASSPIDIQRSTDSAQTSGSGSAFESQVPSLLKAPNTETDEQMNERLVQEREEREKLAKEKEERERREREEMEERKRAEEAERQQRDEDERKAREEATRKAEEEQRLVEEARRKEELRAAERKAMEESKQKADEDRATRAREEAQRKAEENRRVNEEAKRKREELQAKMEAERKAKERKANEEATRRANEETEHKAKVDKMREEMEKLAKREAEIKAKRAREREARAEEERKKIERKAKEDKARVDKMREEMERMIKKEAELKAKKEAEHKAKVDKMREDMERIAQREAELRAEREREERREMERKAWEEEEAAKMRRQEEKRAQRMAERQAKKEAKRKAREAMSIEVPAPPEAPPQGYSDEDYDFLLLNYYPHMYAGDLSEHPMPIYSRSSTSLSHRGRGRPYTLSMSRNPRSRQFYSIDDTSPGKRPRPPSPSLSNFPELPSGPPRSPTISPRPPTSPPKFHRVLRLETAQQKNERLAKEEREGVTAAKQEIQKGRR
ncbi:unnamed protein product [Rhizoctonia solani]|uniref:Uncharacterized protein n=1 Tax=Rhizoctonia solani TaxID=456999 RepID=A0A8H3GEE8_9AGAM|nr:unnamed protein product [Rhizoctonia solani]